MRKIEPFDGGIIVVDKPAGWTSHDVVNRVRRLYDTRQVGHTGTLDPLATGVLAVLVGRAVKASEYLSAHDKCYEARFRLGVVSDTGDITGSLTETGAPIPPADAALAAAALRDGGPLCGRALDGGYSGREGYALRAAALWRDLICSM